MKCPKCSSTEDFFIDARCVIHIGEDNDSEKASDFYWDVDADCTCNECSHSCPALDFEEDQ